MHKTIIPFLISALTVCSCGSISTDPFNIDEGNLHEVIRRDAFFFYNATRKPDKWEGEFKNFTIPYWFGEYHSYYPCYMHWSKQWCKYDGPFFDLWFDYDEPVEYSNGFTFTLLPCTSFPNYIVWKDHRVWVLSDAYALGYLSTEDMKAISSVIDSMYEQVASDMQEVTSL